MTPIRVPGSKSLTHRAYVLAGASDQPCTIRGALRSQDTDATLQCIQALGAQVEVGDTIRTRPGYAEPAQLDCANAGTGLRLLMGQAALRKHSITLTGDASLQSRPNQPLVDALQALGVQVQGDNAPVTVHGPMHHGTVAIDASSSSQFASSLLLALPQVEGPSKLELSGVSSRPYLDLTLDMARQFGLRIDHDFSMPGGDVPRAMCVDVEGDWSTAAFPLVAGALFGRARVAGVDDGSRQGDRRILDLLTAFGADVRGLDVRAGDLVSPGTIDIRDTPDLFPILCILAARAEGTTTFTGGESLRIKESDRIAAMAQGLARIGIRVEPRNDGLIVHGGRFKPGTVDAHGDHRIHMAFAIAAALEPGIRVSDRGCEAVSYPQFYEHLQRIQEAA